MSRTGTDWDQTRWWACRPRRALTYGAQLHGDDVLLATWDNALNAAARATGQLLANDTA